jgi:hypothetical protein
MELWNIGILECWIWKIGGMGYWGNGKNFFFTESIDR